MKVHIPTNFPDFFSLWKDSLGFETSQTDRQTQTGNPHLRRQTDSQHECEPEIKYRFNIPPRPLCQARQALISLPSLPSRALGRDPGSLGPSGLVQSRLRKRLRYLLLGFPRPQMQGSRLRPGREAPATAAAAARPPSLPPSSSPSLPLSLPRALPLAGPSRGQPVLDQIQVSPKERKKERPSHVEKKERKTLNCIYFPCSDHWSASVRTSWTQPCSGGGVPGLLPRPRWPPRPAHCTLHTLGRRTPAAPTPNRPQGPSYRLNIWWPASPRASAREPALLHLRPKSTHKPPCPCSRARPAGHPSRPRRPLATLGPRPCPGCKPPPLHGHPHKARCPHAPTRSPLSPAPAALHLFPGRAASPSALRQGDGPGRWVLGSPREATEDRQAKPEPRQMERDLRDQGSPWRALAFSSVSRKS